MRYVFSIPAYIALSLTAAIVIVFSFAVDTFIRGGGVFFALIVTVASVSVFDRLTRDKILSNRRRVAVALIYLLFILASMIAYILIRFEMLTSMEAATLQTLIIPGGVSVAIGIIYWTAIELAIPLYNDRKFLKRIRKKEKEWELERVKRNSAVRR